jgi:SAM-dependent methyltransferase
MKILVGIANHGTKNRHFLERLLSAYRAVRHEVTIVVLSDRPKPDLPPDVEVVVGVPTSNPRSLPFAHRRLFAERADQFDLFIYTEDDTLIEERHIDAFLRMNALLPDDEIPGFMRYELRPSGERSYCSVHSHYRWDTETVHVRDGEVFASFTNQHSACHMMTKEQLRRAIDSGGFLVPPHEGAYGMLESAATDPYTKCGFKRRIAISRIEDFLLHHLPNIYLDKLGISPGDFHAQLAALEDIARGRTAGNLLVDPGAKLPVGPWGLPCYPRAFDELRRCTPSGVRTVLTVGSTAGILERELFGDAATVVGIPIDNALGAVAGRRNIEVTPPEWGEAMKQVRGRAFDVVLLHDVLHRFADPARILRELRELLARGSDSRILITMPNFWYYRLRKAFQGRPDVLPSSYSESGMHQPTWRHLRRWLSESGLTPDRREFRVPERIGSIANWLPPIGRAWVSQELIVRAKPL